MSAPSNGYPHGSEWESHTWAGQGDAYRPGHASPARHGRDEQSQGPDYGQGPGYGQGHGYRDEGSGAGYDDRYGRGEQHADRARHDERDHGRYGERGTGTYAPHGFQAAADRFGDPDGYDPEDGFEEPRRRRGLRIAVVAGAGVLALALVGAVAYGSNALGLRDTGVSSSDTSVVADGTDQATTAPEGASAPAMEGSAMPSDPAATTPVPTEGATMAPPTPGSTPTTRKPAPTPTKPRTTAPATGNGVHSAEEQQVLDIVNAERAKAGCKPVTGNAALAVAARKHSQDMADRDYFSHTTPDGVSFSTRMTNAGYRWSGAGENIAKGQRTPADVMKAWMNSSGHRANILNCGFKNLGVGLAMDGGTKVWTQDFGSPA